MKIASHTVRTRGSKKAIWAVWENVEAWNSWDEGIEHSTLFGPFSSGTKGELKPKGGPLIKTKLTRVVPHESFVDEAQLSFTTIVMTHTMKEVGDALEVTHTIEMKGALAFFFAFVIGRDMKKNLPHEMKRMVEVAEEMGNG